MKKLFKYPRTYHLPWSSGTDDDKILKSIDHFIGKEIVISEKCDGENCTMYRDHIHARSVDGLHHPSRTWVKQLHGSICNDIAENWRLTGENLFAKHSIHYHNLPSYFLMFGIYDENNLCLSWDDTIEYAEMLGLKTVPVLYRGLWDEKMVRACWTGLSTVSSGDEQEGYVVRLVEAFPYDKHAKSTAKFVRKNHVQTSSHWMTEKIVPNILQLQI